MFATVFVCSVVFSQCFAAMDARPHTSLAECEAVFPALSSYAAGKIEEGAFPTAPDYTLRACCSRERPTPEEEPECVNEGPSA